VGVGEFVDVAVVVKTAVAVEVEVVANGFSSSLGHGCPGNKLNDEFAAFAFCTSKKTLAFGLITPTIWWLIHDPGAPQ
jgi:hypothetical protein